MNVGMKAALALANDPKALELLKKKAKKKIMLAIAPIAVKVSLIITIVIIIVALFMASIDNINSAVIKGIGGVDKFYNFVIFGEAKTSHDRFFSELKEEASKYEKFNYKLDGHEQLDIPLIAATVHLGDYITTNNGITPETSGSFGDVVDVAKQTAFYAAAADSLGTITGHKLIGNLAGSKVGTICKKSIFDEGVPLKETDTYKIVSDFALELGYKGEDLANFLDIANLFKQMSKLGRAVNDLVLNGNDAVSYWINSEKEHFVEGVSPSNFLKKIDPNLIETDCTEGESIFPIFYKYNDYDGFATHLKQSYFNTRWYTKTDNTEFKNASPERQELIMDEWVDMILQLRNAYAELQDKDSVTARGSIFLGVPGSSSYPIMYSRNTEEIVVTSPYGYRKHPVDKTIKMHNGIDLIVKDKKLQTSVSNGMPILAIGDGTVKSSGYHSTTGYFVKLNHDVDGDEVTDFTSIYYHMLEEPTLQKGDKVFGGHQIGKIGSTGPSTGPHLHFELRDANYVSYDPAETLRQLQAAANSTTNENGPIIDKSTSESQKIEYDNIIINSVKEKGYSTRAGVVEVLYALNYSIKDRIPYATSQELLDFDSRRPINRKWSKEEGTGLTSYGLFKWALYHGGYLESAINSLTFDKLEEMSLDYGHSSMIEDIKLGDIFYNSKKDISMLVNIKENKYIVATMDLKSGGSLIKEINIDGTSFGKVVHLDTFYNDKSNVGVGPQNE